MTSRYILALDVGTSGTKTTLWREDGHLAASASAGYTLHRPDALTAEIDPALWWDAVCTTTRSVVAQAGVAPSDIAGIGVDGVGWTLIPVDTSGHALAPAMIWLDRRAQSETAALNGRADAQALIDLDANPLDAAYITPKLLWLKAYQPRIFDEAACFLTASGYLVARLTGEMTCDYTQAYGFHFFDMENACWDAATAAKLGIPLEKLPPLYACSGVVGGLTSDAAQQMGLIPGIPVIAGCLDAASGAFGSGVTRLGQTNEQGGQAGGMAVSLAQVVVEPQLIFSHHVLPGQYLLQAGTVGGGSLGWYRDLLGMVDTDAPFEQFSAWAGETPAGAHGLIFLPYMAGERTPLWNSAARGVFFGLSYASTRADMARAIMEGCAFAVYDNMRLAEEKGVVVEECLGSGGATRSAVWCQIKADIYNRPFVVARRDDGGEGGHSLGLFALTAAAVGLVDDAGATVERLLSQRQVYEPNAQRHAMYEDLFGIYHTVSRRLLSDFDALASVSARHGLSSTR
jgi:xylulokinase